MTAGSDSPLIADCYTELWSRNAKLIVNEEVEEKDVLLTWSR